MSWNAMSQTLAPLLGATLSGCGPTKTNIKYRLLTVAAALLRHWPSDRFGSTTSVEEACRKTYPSDVAQYRFTIGRRFDRHSSRLDQLSILCDSLSHHSSPTDEEICG